MDEKLAVFLGKLAKAHERGLLDKAARHAQNSEAHPDDGQIRAYMAKRLTGDEEKRILAHLVFCDACHRRAMQPSFPDNRNTLFVEIPLRNAIAANRRKSTRISMFMAAVLAMPIVFLGICVLYGDWRATQTVPLSDSVRSEQPSTNSVGSVSVTAFPAATRKMDIGPNVPPPDGSAWAIEENSSTVEPAKSVLKPKPPGLSPQFCKANPSDPRCFQVGGR